MVSCLPMDTRQHEIRMKSFQDRIWLVLLGVAVAILVTLTPVFWNEPTSYRRSTDSGPTQTSSSQALIPRLAGQLIQLLPSRESIRKQSR